MSLVDQVTEQLATIELKDEDISEYITGIIEDESMEEDEKREVIADFLAETTDKSTDALIDKLLSDWKSHQEDKLNQEKEQKQKKLEEVKAQEKVRQEKAEQEQQKLVAERNAQKEKSAEEKKARNKLLEQYSYVQDGPENKNEQPAPSPDTKDHRRKGKAHDTAGDPLLEANRNADLVKEKEKARRDQMKQASDKEKERNKMLMDKQKKEKTQDKEKKKTQKGERRRM